MKSTSGKSHGTLEQLGATGSVGRISRPAPAEIWQRYAADIRGAKALPCGHYLSEEAPEETYKELREFFVGAS